MEELQRAIRLREDGRREEARELLVDLARRHPEDPHVAYQTAWVHDVLGLEREAVPHYVRALDVPGLSPEDRHGALLGLGSTHRALGNHTKSLGVFDAALAEYPDDPTLRTFRAMALHNLGRGADAVGDLLKLLAETTSDRQLASYGDALRYYADHLDESAD